MKLKLGRIKSLWSTRPWLRVALAVFIVIPFSASLLWFSIYKRLPVIPQMTRELISPIRLKVEIDSMKRKWHRYDADAVRSRWEELKKNVPDNYDELSGILEGMNRLASTSGFKMKYTLGDIESAVDGTVGFSLLPIKVNLKVLPPSFQNKGATPPDLQRFIVLLKNILDTYYGFDITDISVVGHGNGIKEMDVYFNLWVGFHGETAKLH